MRKVKRIICIMLAVFMIFGMAACNNDQTLSATDDKTDNFVPGTLHRVNTSESSRKFISGGTTDYRIVVADSASEATEAARFIAKHLQAATDVPVALIDYEDSASAGWTANANYIYVGKNSAFDAAGLTMPPDDLGQSGYYIKTAGNSVFIATEGIYGYQMGAIAFLRETIGYDMISENRVLYNRVPTTLPDMDITERPDFDYRHWSNPLSQTALYGMGFSMHSDMIPVGGRNMHNSFKWLNPDEYRSEHPKWYADNNKQLCYTAHGDEKEYEAMQNEIFEKMKILADLYPSVNTISVSQEDDPDFCTCDTCKAAIDKYGSINGTTIPFLNDLSDKMNLYLKAQAEANGTEMREFYIIQFAYQATAAAPVKQNADGEWVPIDETVRCRDTVGIEIAPIEAKFTRDIEHQDNTYYMQQVSKWSAVTKNIYFWWYQTNFHYYMFPYNCWDNLVNHYRFCAQLSSRYMFNEGQLGQNNGTAFTKLKDYIDSKALFNVNVNTEDLIDRWFEGQFKDAAEPMRAYFNELQTYLTYLQDEYAEVFSGSIYEPIGGDNVQTFWKKKTIDGYMEYIEQAYAAIEPYRESDPELFAALYDNITIESIFPRYVLCNHYNSYYNATEIREMRVAFKADCVRLGLVYEKEHSLLTGLWSVWGI